MSSYLLFKTKLERYPLSAVRYSLFDIKLREFTNIKLKSIFLSEGDEISGKCRKSFNDTSRRIYVN